MRAGVICVRALRSLGAPLGKTLSVLLFSTVLNILLPQLSAQQFSNVGTHSFTRVFGAPDPLPQLVRDYQYWRELRFCGDAVHLLGRQLAIRPPHGKLLRHTARCKNHHHHYAG